MIGMFDPYYQWLGIPPEEQPPHYYRLLGVALFEPNLDVIESAANRQISYLQSCQSGASGEFARKLLSEVAAAKICLLSPPNRAAYDQQLKRYLDSLPPVGSQYQAGPAPPPVVTAELVAAQAVVLEKSDAPPEPAPEIAKKRREAQRLALAGVMCAGLLLIAALVIWQSSRHNRDSAIEVVRGDRRLVDRKESDGQTEKTAPAEQPAEKKSPEAGNETPAEGNETTPTPPKAAPKDTQKPVKPKLSSKSPPEDEEPADPSETGETPVEEPPQRLAVPTAAEQAEVAKLANEMFPVAKDASAADRLKVANDLLGLADKTGTNPAERFYLLRRASELSRDAGEAALMLQTLDVISAEYEVDPFKAKEIFLLKFGENVLDPVRLTAFVAASKDFIADACAEDRFDMALNIAKLVSQACQRPAGKTFRKEALETVQKVQRLQSRYAGVREALAALGADPDNPLNNLKVGRWYALACNKWEKAIPYLAKGPQDALVDAARRETETPPETPEDELKQGDLWWDLAQTSEGEDREAILRHTAFWYEKARVSLSTGLLQVKLDKRLAEIAAILGEDSKTEGNNALATSQWTEILSKVDVKRDAFAGEWKRNGEAVATSKADYARLLLPVQIQGGNYDLDVEFNRTDGNDAVAVILPVGDKQCAFVFSAAGGVANGFELVSGMPVTNRRNTAVRRPGLLQNNRVTKVLFSVRHENDKVQIDVVLNGKPYLRSGGFLKELSLPGTWSISDARRPAVGANQSALLIRRARVRLISGDAFLVTNKPEGSLPSADSRF